MTHENGNEQVIEVEAGGVKARAKNYRIIDIVWIGIALCGALGLYIVSQHDQQTRENGTALASAIREFAAAQREMACIISLPQEERERQYVLPGSFCKRMAMLP